MYNILYRPSYRYMLCYDGNFEHLFVGDQQQKMMLIYRYYRFLITKKVVAIPLINAVIAATSVKLKFFFSLAGT